MAAQPQPKQASSATGSSGASTSGESGAVDANESNFVIVDLGKQNRKRIKKLRNGRGKLLGKIENIISELHEEDVVPADATVVVVIVKEKRSGIFDD
jgi:hypothetical protein